MKVTIRKTNSDAYVIWKGEETSATGDLTLYREADKKALESELSDKDKLALKYGVAVQAEIDNNWIN